MQFKTIRGTIKRPLHLNQRKLFNDLALMEADTEIELIGTEVQVADDNDNDNNTSNNAMWSTEQYEKKMNNQQVEHSKFEGTQKN